jgi:hypothetical protein
MIITTVYKLLDNLMLYPPDALTYFAVVLVEMLNGNQTADVANRIFKLKVTRCGGAKGSIISLGHDTEHTPVLQCATKKGQSARILRQSPVLWLLPSAASFPQQKVLQEQCVVLLSSIRHAMFQVYLCQPHACALSRLLVVCC